MNHPPRFREDPIPWRIHLAVIALNSGLALGALLAGEWRWAVWCGGWAALIWAFYRLLVALEYQREARRS